MAQVIVLLKLLLLLCKYADALVSTQKVDLKLGRACEGSILNIGCQLGYTIEMTRLVYGRVEATVCNDDGRAPILQSCCIAKTTYSILLTECENKQSCSVAASNSVFGDPCVGTYKYLEVEYHCVPLQISSG